MERTRSKLVEMTSSVTAKIQGTVGKKLNQWIIHVNNLKEINWNQKLTECNQEDDESGDESDEADERSKVHPTM